MDKDKDDPVKHWLIWGIVFLGTIASVMVVAYLIGRPRPNHGNMLTACKSNLKNLGTACEMYSTDYEGKYPSRLDSLTPNYLKTIPSCPSAGKVTYRAQFGPSAPMNSSHYQDYYYLECYGENHKKMHITGDYPAYNGVQGLIERAPGAPLGP